MSLLLLAAAVLLGGCAMTDESIVVVPLHDVYGVTVPVSKLILYVPRGGLVPRKPEMGGTTDSPRYFYFEDAARGLVVSGWFESDVGFPGAERYWTTRASALKQRGLPEPQNVQLAKIGNWDVVEYEIALSPITSSEIVAHWVEAGTWIDLHVSLSSDRPPAEKRKGLESFLQQLEVKHT